MKNKINWKTLINIIFIILAMAVMVYLCISKNGLVDLVKNISAFDMGWISMAVICYLINMAADVYLIYLFTKDRYREYRIKDAIKCSMVGQFFSAVTPGASGGQPMQVMLFSKQGVDTGIGTSALIQKFLVYQSTLVCFSAAAILVCHDLVAPQLKWTTIFGFVAQAVVILLLVLFSFNKKLTNYIISFVFNLLGKLKILKNVDQRIESLEEQLECFHDSNKELYKNKNLVLTTYVLTAIQLVAIFIVPYCIYRGFKFSGARIVDMLGMQAFVTMVSCFMPLPGASGAAEGSFYFIFSAYFSEETIKSAMLLWRLITYYFVILISAPFSRITKNKKINSED